jgi:hypothetical protein
VRSVFFSSLLAFVCGAIPLTAFQAADPVNKSQRERVRDFDIRSNLAESQPATVARSRALVRRRLSAGRTQAALLAERSAWRLSMDEFGMPKALFRERGALTLPSSGPPEQIARVFLGAHSDLFYFSRKEIETLRVVRKQQADGLTLLRFKQTVNNVDVFQSQVRVTLDGQGRIVEAGVSDVVPGLSLSTTPAVGVEDAVLQVYRLLQIPVSPGLRRLDTADSAMAGFENPLGAQLSPVTAELCVFPMSADSAVLAYRLLVEIDAKGWYEILLDAADGRLLFLQNLYRNAAGRVWKESPLKGTREMTDFSAGWLDGQVTTGNNVDAYLDADGDNKPDTTTITGIQNGRAFSATQQFDFPFGDRNSEQSPKGFKPAAVTNLFYFVNLAHDYYYGLGFDEASGNFQQSNFGKGGAENDAVNAEAQDGATNDNANFATTPDGTKPRLQVGLFTYGSSSSADANWNDADHDGMVIFHEYAHGVTNRIIGAGVDLACLIGTQSRAMGEGWSDYFAISYFNNPVVGAYVGLDPFKGIRRNSYERYPYTYEDLGNHGLEVHNDGEIWAATLWDIRKQLGQDATDKLIVAALRLTPCKPSMPNARDAILLADDNLNGSANRGTLWQVFARHGLGQSASGIDGSLHEGTVFTAAYDLPPDMAPGNHNLVVTAGPIPRVSMGQDFVYDVPATDQDGGALVFELVKGPDGMTVDGSTGRVTWTAPFVGALAQVAVTGAGGVRVLHAFNVYVETPLDFGQAATIAGTAGTSGYATFTVPDSTPILQVMLRQGTGDADLYLADPNGVYVAASLRNGNSETLSIPLPAAGKWTVEVDGYRNYADVTLTPTMPTPRKLDFPGVLTDLSGDYTSESFFTVTVPEGAANLLLTTSGGTGSTQMYARKGLPTACSSSTLSAGPCPYDGYNSPISFNKPAAADYFIDLKGVSAFSGVTLRASGAPVIDGIATSPNPPADGQSFTFTITGSSFDPSVIGVTFTGPGCTSGCSISNYSLTAKSPTAIGGKTTLSAGTFRVTVQNGSNGTPSAGVNLVVSKPAISGIATSPSPPVDGQSFTFTIAGSGFEPGGVSVTFTGPGCTSGCSVSNSSLTAKSATEVTGKTTLSAGTFSVTVRNGYSGTPSGGFNLVVSKPAISGIATSPTPPAANQSFTFTITGSGFDPSAILAVFTGPGCTSGCYVSNSSLSTKSATQVVGKTSLSAGTFSVTVQNGYSGTPSTGVNLTVR